MLAGAPNAGKSSLLNIMCGKDAAIVTEIAGTTRDLVTQNINLNGVPVEIVDTAGIRETEHIIELKGIEKTKDSLKLADHILLIFDVTAEQSHKELSENFLKLIPPKTEVTMIFNKIDLQKQKAVKQEKKTHTCIYLSALTGDGVEILRQHILDKMGFNNTVETCFMARQRHITALETAKTHIAKTLEYLHEKQQADFIAEELKLSHKALGEITGRVTSDDLLGKIFSSFCIGK